MAEQFPGRLGAREGAASLAPKTEVVETHAYEVPPSKAHVSNIAGGMGPRLDLIQKLRDRIERIEQRPVSFSPPPRDTGRAGPACAPSGVRAVPHADERASVGAGACLQRRGGTKDYGADGRAGESGDAFGEGVSYGGDGDEKASALFPPWSFGIPEIDRALPWNGLKPSGLHEIKPAGPRDTPVARAFALALMVRYLAVRSKHLMPMELASCLEKSNREQTAKRVERAEGWEPSLRSAPRANGTRAPFLYCLTERSAREYGLFYGPGLLALGLDPAALILVRTAKAQDLFWAMEEGLKAGALAGVVGESGETSFTAARRLSLAAESHATPCLMLSNHDAPGIGPALTRWKISSAESPLNPFNRQAPGTPRWRIDLERCRHGPNGLSWIVEWSCDTHCFRLAAPLADRAAETGRQGRGDVRTAG